MVNLFYFTRYFTAAVLCLGFAAQSAIAQQAEKALERPDADSQPRGESASSPREGTPPRPASNRDAPSRDFRGPGGQSGPGSGGPGQGSGGPGFYRGFEMQTEAETKSGFLFIGGLYVPPPYKLNLADNTLTINGQPLDCLPPSRGYGSYGGYGSRGSRGGDTSWRYSFNEILTELGNEMVVLCFKGQPYVALDGSNSYDLLKTMTMEGGRSVRQLTVREQLPPEFDKAIWDEWLDSFNPPGDLRQRAAVLVNRFEAAERAAEADMRATRLMNQAAYPLAVGGMVLSVLAIGHLLGGRPHARQRLIGRDDSPEMIHTLNWSLLFVVAFSLLDLTWTVLAANAGQMQELNPIGSHLIENPRHLIGFKVGITLPSLAVIWLLRKHKRAQAAAWWLCLVLTFVTLRWLMISPLMAPA